MENFTAVCACKRGATIGYDHPIVAASLKIKLAARKPFVNTRRNFDVKILRDPNTKQAFQFEFSAKPM